MKVGVSGTSGKLGTSLVRELKARAAGHRIVGISRTANNVRAAVNDARFGDYDSPTSLCAAYEGLDRILIIPSMETYPEKRRAQNLAAIDAAVDAGILGDNSQDERTLRRVYAADDGAVILVRPDGYIGFRGRTDDWGGLDNYLSKILKVT